MKSMRSPSKLSYRDSGNHGILRIRSRKGFTYILVTTVMVVVLLSIFFATSRYKYQDEESLQQVRIRAMNDFVKNLDNDIHRATYISTFRALLSLEDYVATKSVYLEYVNESDNLNESFRKAFLNGTINGTSSATMFNSTFNDYLAKVQMLANITGIRLNINVTKVRLMQSDPWNIDVYVSMNITMVDSKNTASWNINKEYLTSVPINFLRDPLYSKNTLNMVPNTIRRLNDTLVVGNDTTNLQKHINGSYYLASPYAPNFLMRFEGLTNPDINGIESIVNIDVLSSQGQPRYEERSKIDYMYFNNIVDDYICNIQNIDSKYYFVLPSNRIVLYQIKNAIANLTYSNSSVCP